MFGLYDGLVIQIMSIIDAFIFVYIFLVLSEFCFFISGVSGEGSGVTVESSLVAEEAVATPPAADTKASIL
jgi:hypothetical protein